jgi:D-serine deaminase-like pyridoxal phosphate-dependent protein
MNARIAIGRARDELATPALLLDLDVARRNIETMAVRFRALPALLRPHAKVHKSPDVARLQVEAGAIGVCTATAWEAVAMVRGGIGEVLVANQVVAPTGIAAVAAAARDGGVIVAVDDQDNLDDLSAAATAAGTEIGVLVEVDVGMGRCGARSPEEACRLAEHASRLEGVRLRGVMGYEGHCMLEPDRDLRVSKAHAAMRQLGETVDVLAAAGFAPEIVSAGGTGTYDITGANPLVTEVQAGSYVFMDAFHQSLVPGFPIALTVLATVLSRHGDEVVLDAGRKAVGVDLMPPQLAGRQAETLFVHEEHSGFRLLGGERLRVGDRVELLPGYGPTTVNLYDAYHLVEGGVIADLWPVHARYGTATAG